MPNMVVGQRVLVSAVGDYFGQRTITSWLYKVTDVTGNIDDVVFFDALHTVLTGGTGLLTKFRACCPMDVWLGVAAWYQVLGPVRFRKVQRTLTDGTFDGPSLTANQQASITRVGVFGNRRNIGGIRLPMPTSESVEGKITPDYQAVMNVLGNQMKAAVTAGSPSVTMFPQVGVPGYTNTPIPTPIPVTDSVDMNDFIVQETTRVIRRRTLRVGE